MPTYPPTRRRLLGTLAATAGAALLPGQVSGLRAETPISGPEALATALIALTPGAVLLLAPGNYGSLNLRHSGGAPGAPVKLVGADLEQPPRFDRMELHGVGHLVLEGLHFDYDFAVGDKIQVRPFSVIESKDVTIHDCLFDGDSARGMSVEDNGFGFGYGLHLRLVQGITVDTCEIRDFHRGLVVSQCDDVTVTDNDLHSMRSDGMNFAEVNRVRIEGNHIHDFRRSLESQDHPDMIQFWTNGTTMPSTDIVIRGNVLSSGAGYETQSIFMRNDLVDRGIAGVEMYYRNILIEENVIANAHLHGITVGETDGLTIRQNTVVRNIRSVRHDAENSVWTPQIRVSEAAVNVAINGNIVSKIAGYDGQASWRVTHNLFVQDRTRMESGFYGIVFTGSPADLRNFRYRRAGPADRTKIGAAILQAE